MKIAIIGAGLSGLTLAHHLKDKADTTLFEKSRGVGGRMSTRYADPYQFDHGAQYFTARSAEFQTFLKPFMAQDIVQEWTPKVITLQGDEKPYKRDWFEPHYVSATKMTSLCKHMAHDHDVRLGVHIRNIEDVNNSWHLTDQDRETYGPFDWIISSAPAPQTIDIFPKNFAAIDDLKHTKMTGCFSLMLGFQSPLVLNAQAAVVKSSSIGWIAVNSSKPGRDHSCSILIQSTNEWAEAHIDDDKRGVQAALLAEFQRLVGSQAQPDHIALHAWRYAATDMPAGHDFLWDEDLNLAACGDWCIDGRVEAAFLSGYYVAEKFKKFLG